MAEIKDLSTTDASNTARFPENQNPSTVNDGARALEGMVARGLKDTIDGILITAGTGSAYTATSNRSFTASVTMYNGAEFFLRFHAACADTPTLNVSTTDARKIFWPDGTTLSASDIIANSQGRVKYNTSLSAYVLMDAPVPAKKAVAGILTTRGDLLYRGASVPERLAIDSNNGRILKSDGTDPAWTTLTSLLDINIGGTQGQILYRGAASWSVLSAGTAGQFLQTGGAAANPAWANDKTFVAAQSLSSGNGVTFGSIPAGVRRIQVILNEVSVDDADNLIIQIGTGAALTTTGYVSTTASTTGGAASITSGFGIRSSNAAHISSGIMTLVHMGSNLWIASYAGKASTGDAVHGGGSVTLAGVLDIVGIVDSGGDAFDGGSIAIIYE